MNLIYSLIKVYLFDQSIGQMLRNMTLPTPPPHNNIVSIFNFGTFSSEFYKLKFRLKYLRNTNM